MTPAGRRRPPPPIGFAHRGARAECRDNTIGSFRRALELGAGGLESDAWLTADGIAVLDHDGVVRRGWHQVPIRRMARADLPGHVPSLSELYDACGSGFALSLDVKDPAAAAAVVAAAAAAGAVERLWLCGSGPELAGWRALSPAVGLVDSTRLAQVPEGLAARARRLREARVDAVNLRAREWDAAGVAAVHGAGLLAFAWDAQESPALAALVALGVDAVYSDHVGRMVAALAAASSPSL